MKGSDIMTKLIVNVNSKDQINALLPVVDAFIFGIKKLSMNMAFYLELEELKPLIEEVRSKGKEVFIRLNKNMHDSDLERLEHTLKELDKYDITGVFYYDIAVVQYKEELKLHYPLVWDQEHLVTNYDTVNYWYSIGSTYACLSSEITLEEILKIKKNTKAKLIVPIFGYVPMFTSTRHLVKNYCERFTLPFKDGLHYLKKEGYTYPITDNEDGVSVYSSHILNGLEESFILRKEAIDYLFLSSFLIEDDKFAQICRYFYQITEDTKKEDTSKIDELCQGNTDKGFLYKETVYKVKNHG